MRWKTWQRTLSADVIPFMSAGWSRQWWQSPLTTDTEIANMRFIYVLFVQPVHTFPQHNLLWRCKCTCFAPQRAYFLSSCIRMHVRHFLLQLLMFCIQRSLHDMLYLPFRWTQTVTEAYLPVSGMSHTMTASHLIGGLAVYQSSDSGAKLGRGQSNMASAGCWLVLPAQVWPSQPFFSP